MRRPSLSKSHRLGTSEFCQRHVSNLLIWSIGPSQDGTWGKFKLTSFYRRVGRLLKSSGVFKLHEENWARKQ